MSVARYHLRVNTVSQARRYKLYSLPSDWQRLPVDMTVNSFVWPWIMVRNCFQIENTNRPHGSGEDKDSKLGNSLTLAFLVSKRVIIHDLIPLEGMRMTMYEEISMDFCMTTLG